MRRQCNVSWRTRPGRFITRSKPLPRNIRNMTIADPSFSSDSPSITVLRGRSVESVESVETVEVT